MTPTEAREASGLSLKDAASQARICPAYLRRIERNGGATWILGQRLSRLYRVPLDTFIFATLKERGGAGAKKRSRCEKSPTHIDAKAPIVSEKS